MGCNKILSTEHSPETQSRHRPPLRPTPLVIRRPASAAQSHMLLLVTTAVLHSAAQPDAVHTIVGMQGEQQAEEPAGQSSSALCAVGDMHGDPVHALAALRLCGAVDETNRWAGGKMSVVQTGDVFDRGNASLELQQLLWDLREQASEAGGELVLLLGNHELLNMQGKIFYVHGFSRSGLHHGELAQRGGPAAWRAALHPVDGALGAALASQDGFAVRGEGACRTLFMHAGLRLRHAQKYGSVAELNLELRRQLTEGTGELLDPREGPLWFRGYARPGADEEGACEELRAVLEAVGDGAQRMAVGHNIVPWVSSRCGGDLQLLDVGMSRAYGGKPVAWRCEVDGAGGARLRALYEHGEEEPPALCSRCSNLSPEWASDQDWHDCHDYCGPPGMEGEVK